MRCGDVRAAELVGRAAGGDGVRVGDRRVPASAERGRNRPEAPPAVAEAARALAMAAWSSSCDRRRRSWCCAGFTSARACVECARAACIRNGWRCTAGRVVCHASLHAVCSHATCHVHAFGAPLQMPPSHQLRPRATLQQANKHTIARYPVPRSSRQTHPHTHAHKHMRVRAHRTQTMERQRGRIRARARTHTYTRQARTFVGTAERERRAGRLARTCELQRNGALYIGTVALRL
jgi:hypothetical protein